MTFKVYEREWDQVNIRLLVEKDMAWKFIKVYNPPLSGISGSAPDNDRFRLNNYRHLIIIEIHHENQLPIEARFISTNMMQEFNHNSKCGKGGFTISFVALSCK